jgi:hypothetical protein
VADGAVRPEATVSMRVTMPQSMQREGFEYEGDWLP